MMSDLEDVTDEEAVVQTCTICDVRLEDWSLRKCHLCGIKVCVSHWGPSEHKCKSRMPMPEKSNCVCDEAGSLGEGKVDS